MGKHEEPERRPGVFTFERLAAFSDGLLAIVVTILVLTINVPEHDFSREGILSFLAKTEHDILIYMASFWLVAAYWILHHSLFSFVRYVTRSMILLNFLFLFVVTLLPFSTKFKNTYPKEAVAALTFGITHIACGLTLLLLLGYIFRHPELQTSPLNVLVYRSMARRIFAACLFALTASLFAYVNIRLATFLWPLVPLMYLSHRTEITAKPQKVDEIGT